MINYLVKENNKSFEKIHRSANRGKYAKTQTRVINFTTFSLLELMPFLEDNEIELFFQSSLSDLKKKLLTIDNNEEKYDYLIISYIYSTSLRMLLKT